jgi:hypothetical protein
MSLRNDAVLIAQSLRKLFCAVMRERLGKSHCANGLRNGLFPTARSLRMTEQSSLVGCESSMHTFHSAVHPSRSSTSIDEKKTAITAIGARRRAQKGWCPRATFAPKPPEISTPWGLGRGEPRMGYPTRTLATLGKTA